MKNTNTVKEEGTVAEFNKAAKIAALQNLLAEVLGEVETSFSKSKDGNTYLFPLRLADLPVWNPAFLEKACQCIGGALAWRSKAGLGKLPAGGGEVTLDAFVMATLALDFRGDEKPNADDVKEAKGIVNAVESKLYTAEAAAKQIMAQYGWEIEPTAEGFARHYMLKRIAARSKSGPITLDVL